MNEQPDQIWTVKELETLRNAVIEECAQVADRYKLAYSQMPVANAIAAEIRTLKNTGTAAGQK